MRKNWIIIGTLALILFLPNNVFGALEISDGSVKALYHLDSDTIDASGHAYNLTASGTNFSYETGKLGAGSLGMNENPTSTNTSFRYTNDVGCTQSSCSLSVWFFPSSTLASGKTQVLIGTNNTNGSAGSAYWIEYNNNTGTKRIRFWRNVTGVGNVSINYNTNLSNWNYLTLTYGSNVLRGYLNGVEVASTTDSTTGGNASTPITELGIHPNTFEGTTQHLVGNLDEVIIFSTQISTGTISSLWNNGTGTEVCVSVGCGTISTSSASFNFMSTSTDAYVGFFFHLLNFISIFGLVALVGWAVYKAVKK